MNGTAQRLVLATVLLLVGLVGAAAPNGAGAKGAGQHCVVESASGVSAASNYQCFETFAEAVAAATGGRVRLDRGVRPSELTDRMLGQDAASRGVGVASSGKAIVGLGYEDRSFGGRSVAFTTANLDGCRFGSSFSYRSLSGFWNDEIESIRTFTGCTNAQVFFHANFGGTSQNCFESCATFRSRLVNEISSAKFSCPSCSD